MNFRKILHVDLDAFFCAVEEQREPSLRGKPFAVGGKPEERGVVSSCSYAARQFGVHSAMPTGQALRLCPELALIPGNHGLYRAASEQVMGVLGEFTPLLEQLSIDEAFLDVSDLPQPAAEIGYRVQRAVNERTGLPCSLGVASNKLVAKMATDHGKASKRGPTAPNALLEIPAGQEATFLAGLPVQALWGVGPKLGARLNEVGVTTIGQLTAMPENQLVRMFGRIGHELVRHAQGVDDRPVVTVHQAQSISQEVTFQRDVSDAAVLRGTLLDMSGDVAYRLRQHGLCAATVRLKLRWPDFTTLSRQMSLERPTQQDKLIGAVALKLFDTVWQPGRSVRLIGVGTSGLSQQAFQPGLWETPNEKEQRLLGALDELRERFGRPVVQAGRSLYRSGPKKK